MQRASPTTIGSPTEIDAETRYVIWPGHHRRKPTTKSYPTPIAPRTLDAVSGGASLCNRGHFAGRPFRCVRNVCGRSGTRHDSPGCDDRWSAR
jgi:hypothetical protein